MIAVSSLQKSVFKLIRSESIISSFCIFLFENTNYIAAKNFLYKDDLPYCYVNDLFIELLGYKKINFADLSASPQTFYQRQVRLVYANRI